MGTLTDTIRQAGRQSAVPSEDGAGIGYIDEREQAIVERHKKGIRNESLFQQIARGEAELAIEARRQQRAYAEKPPSTIAQITVDPAREMVENLGDRAKVLDTLRKLSPEQREEALRLVPGIAQQLGDDRGGAVGRTLGALSRGVSSIAQPAMELAGKVIGTDLGGTPEEIAFIRQMEAAKAQEFAPALPSDPWYERYPLQALEMVPFSAATIGGGAVGGAIGKTGGQLLARGAAAGVPGAKTAIQAAGAVGRIPTAVGLPAMTAQGVGTVAGITAVGFPGQYAQEIDQLKELGVEDGPGMQALAVGTSLVSSALEAIMPNPLKGVLPAGAVAMREGATKAARQYLWEAVKRAPPEMTEEYAQGLASGLGKTVASYLDMTTKDVTLGDAFATSFEQGNAAIGPMAFLLGVPALAGAGAVGLRARGGTPPGPPPPLPAVTQAPPEQPTVVAPGGIPPAGTLPEVTPPVDQTAVVPPTVVPNQVVPQDQSQRLARLQEIRRKGFVSEDEAIEVGTGGKNRKERLANLEKAIEQETSQGGAAPPAPTLPQGVPDAIQEREATEIPPRQETEVGSQVGPQVRDEGQAEVQDAAQEVPVGTYEEFRDEYRRLFSEMMKYSPDEVGSSHFAEKMAVLADQNPEWAERVESEQEVAKQKTVEPRKFSYQNGRVQVEVPPPYEVGGKSVQPFVMNGKTYLSADEFRADAAEAYAETVKRYPDIASQESVPVTDVAKPPVTPETQQKSSTAGLSEGVPVSPTVSSDALETPGTRTDEAEGENWSSEARAETGARRMEPTEEGRPEDGKPIMPGDRFLTNTGRETTPYPKYSGSTNRQVIASEKKSQLWLMENAIAEAESRGDDFNLNMFRGELEDARKGKLPQSSKDSATLYVFGDYIPNVPKPFLKEPSRQPTSSEPTVEQDTGTSRGQSGEQVGNKPEISRDELRAKFKDESDKFDKELADLTKSLSSQKARTKNRAKIDQLETQFREGKSDIEKRRSDSLQPLMEEIRNHPDSVAERQQAGEAVKAKRESEKKVMESQKEETEKSDWAKVQESGGYESVRAGLEDNLKKLRQRIARTKAENQWKLPKPEFLESQIEYLDTLNKKFSGGNKPVDTAPIPQPEAGVPTTTAEQKPAEGAPPDRVQQIQDAFPLNREQAIVADILADVTSPPGEVKIALPGTPIPDAETLFQKQRDPQGDIQAWTHFVNASKAIIGATDKADISSFFHEWAHPLRKFLFNREVSKEDRGNITDDDIQKIEEFVGVKDGNWTRENEEGFVDALMSYWMEGKSPTPELETVFQKISAWLSKVISVIQRKVELNDEVRAIFDKVHLRGGVDPKKLQALKEAGASEKSGTAEESAEDSEAEFDDVFADVFEEEATVAPEPEQESQPFKRGDIVSAFGRDEAKVLIPDLGDLSFKKGNVRIEMTSGPNKGKTMDVEPSDIRQLAEEDTIAGKAAKEARDKAAAKQAEDEKLYNTMRDELLPLVRRIKKSGVILNPKTKKAKKELLYKVMTGTQNRNERMIQEAIDIVSAEAVEQIAQKQMEATVAAVPVKAEFIELKGLNATGVKQTIRVIAGERTLLMERSKYDSEWSIKEPDEYTGEVQGKTPVKTKGEILASGIGETKRAKEIAQQIIDGTFDKDADQRFVREDTKNIGLTNAGLADEIKNQLQRRGSFAKLLREESLFTDGRLLMKVSEKDRDAILKRVGETDEGRSLNVVAQMMTDGQKALSRSANAMKPIGYRGGELTTRTVVLQSQDGDATIVDKALHDTVLKKHPNAVPYFLEKGRPVSYASNGDVVAIVMPIEMTGKPDARLKQLLAGKYDFEAEAIGKDTLLQASVDHKRQAAQLAKDALEGGAATFEDYVDYAVQEIGADKVKASASVMEGFWNYLRTREGYDYLPEAGKVADVLAEKPEPAKPEKPKEQPKQKQKQPEKPAEKPTGRFFPRVPGVRKPGQPFPETEPEPYEPHELTGMAKAVMNDLRELAGIPELEAAPPETIEQWALDAQSTMAADPHAATRLLNDIIANPARALDHHDVMLLAFRYRALVNEAEPHFQEVVDANASGNAERIAKARTNYILARQPVTEFEELTLKAKSTWGRTGVALQVLLRRDNTVAGLLRRAREANHGKPLTPEQEIEMRDLAKRFADIQKKLDEETARADKAEAELASLRHLKELVKESPTRKRPSKEQKSELDKSWADIAKLANVNVLFQRDATNPFHNNVQVYRDLGVETFAELRRHVQERLGKEQAAKLEDKFKEAWEATKPETEVPANIDRGNLAQLTREARRIERSIVEGLLLDHTKEAVLEMRDEIVNAVHAEMQELMDESFTHRQTMDALSGYGQFSRPSQDTTDTLLRNLNAEVLKLRQIDQLGDAVARTEQLRAEGKADSEIADTLIKEGLLVAQTGLVRDTPTDRLRDLNRKYSELKKDISASSEGRAGLLQTAIAAIERGLTNRIRDLNHAINKQEPIKIGRKPSPTNENIEQLKEERDALLKEYRKLFPAEKKKLTPEQRLANAIKAAERSIEVLEKQIATRNFDKQEQVALPESPELTELRERLEHLRDQRNVAKSLELSQWESEGGAVGPDPKEAAYRKAYIASLSNRIAKLQQFLREGDFSPQEKKLPRILSKEELDLKRQLAELNTEKLKKMADYHLKNLKGIAWTADKVSEVLHLARAVETMADLSALGRQGGLIALGHPALAKNALVGVIKSMAQAFNKSAIFNKQDLKPSELEQFLTGIDSRKAELAFMHQLTEGEDAELRMLAGLDLPSTDQAITRQEEVFQGRWGKYFPGVAISSRLYTMILNKMRADMFDLMVEKLGRQGKPTLEEAKLIASFVNVMTGRSDLKQFNSHAATLNNVFFAPRYVASRFQYLAMPFYLPFKGGVKANWQIKRAIYREYARTASGAMLTLGLISMAGYLFWDDDDEDKPTVGFDPTTSDFLKPKFGETRLDFLAGLQQVFVLSARMLPEELGGGRIGDKKYGEGGPYAQSRATVIARFLRTKLAPGPGYVVTGLNDWENVIGEKADRVFGLKVHPAIGTTTNLFFPLSMQSVADAFETQPVPVAAGASILSILGVGMSTYGPKTEYMTGTPEERQKQITDDLESLEWDAPDPSYSEFLTKEQLDQFEQRRANRVGLKLSQAISDPESELGKKTRDKALELIKESKLGRTRAEAIKAYIDYWRENNSKNGRKASTHEIVDGSRVMKAALRKGINKVKALYRD